MAIEMICSTCGNKGVPVKQVSGSFIIALILLFFFIVPGLIYVGWRLSSKKAVCRSCKSSLLVSLDSPRGIELNEKYQLIQKEA